MAYGIGCYFYAHVTENLCAVTLYIAIHFQKGRNKKMPTTSNLSASEWIILVVSLILGTILAPIVVDQVQDTNTTGWTFTGATGAKTLFLLLPFVFIVGIVVYFIGKLLGKI